MFKPFKLKKAHNGEFYIITVSENGRTLDKSETYKRKRTCVKKVKAIFRLTKSVVPDQNVLNYIEDCTLRRTKKAKLAKEVATVQAQPQQILENSTILQAEPKPSDNVLSSSGEHQILQ